MNYCGNELNSFSTSVGGQAARPLAQQATEALSEWRQRKDNEAVAMRAQQECVSACKFDKTAHLVVPCKPVVE